MYLYQTWWKSYPGPISQINLDEIFILGLCVGQLFHWKRENLYYFLNFQDFFIQMGGCFLYTDWLTQLNFSTVCLSVGSLKILIETFVHWQSWRPLVLLYNEYRCRKSHMFNTEFVSVSWLNYSSQQKACVSIHRRPYRMYWDILRFIDFTTFSLWDIYVKQVPFLCCGPTGQRTLEDRF